MESPFDCDICEEKFRSDTRKPLRLTCGHTFCEPCLGGVYMAGIVECPECKEIHEVEVKDLPVNSRFFASPGNVLDKSKIFCTTHQITARYWCNVCQVLSCVECKPLKHDGHNFLHVDEYSAIKLADKDLYLAKAENMKNQLTACLGVTDRMEAVFADYMEQNQALLKTLKGVQKEMEKVEDDDNVPPHIKAFLDKITIVNGKVTNMPKALDVTTLRRQLNMLKKHERDIQVRRPNSLLGYSFKNNCAPGIYTYIQINVIHIRHRRKLFSFLNKIRFYV